MTECSARAFCKVERYGFLEDSYWHVVDLRQEGASTSWKLLRGGQEFARLRLPMAGEHNALNATAAAAMAYAYGIAKEQIAAALKTFKSVKRRLEVKAQVNGITIIDDFAHHPTAIAGTLRALRARYEGARLWAILEPRSNTLRRRVLQNDLARSLALADEVVVAGVFRSDAVPENERLDLHALAADIQKRGRRARLIADADQIVQTIAPEMRNGDVIAFVSTPVFPAEARSAAMCDPSRKIPWLTLGSMFGLTGSWNGGTNSRAPFEPIWWTS